MWMKWFNLGFILKTLMVASISYWETFWELFFTLQLTCQDQVDIHHIHFSFLFLLLIKYQINLGPKCQINKGQKVKIALLCLKLDFVAEFGIEAVAWISVSLVVGLWLSLSFSSRANFYWRINEFLSTLNLAGIGGKRLAQQCTDE